jgi:hypothetical protein
MSRQIKRWYQGETKLHEFESDPNSSVWFAPYPYIDRHWSAKAVRALVVFYLRNWQWAWATTIAALGLYVAVRTLK